MSPEDQIAAIAGMRADYKHIMKALEGMGEKIDALQKEVGTLRAQVEDLKRGSPANIGSLAVKIAAGVMALVGAWSLLDRLPK